MRTLWKVITTVLGIFIGIFYEIWRQLSGAAAYEQQIEQRRALALSCLKKRLPPNEAKRINLNLMRQSPDWAELIRNFQIIADSFDIAMQSKKPEVAQSRMTCALELIQESKHKNSYLLSEKNWLFIDQYSTSIQEKFETTWRINCVTALLEKAKTLKTAKAKVKYLEEAQEIASAGLLRSDVDQMAMRKLLSQISTSSG